ncbi:MAG TPA: hypothetical protein VFZ21_20885 [Gemmatimonadaceae bacterium]|nr:hypothetical protein [Gemmatimonadaceae bacterium]
MRTARLTAVGFAAGFVVGLVVWSREQHARRRDLFHAHPLRRFAALTYLRGQRTPETASLLKDYIRWEQRSDLKRRARRLLDRVERQLA